LISSAEKNDIIRARGSSRFATAHWSIENSLHYVRDVTLGEDLSQVRVGNAPRVFATLRNLVMSIIRVVTDADANIAKMLRYLGRHPDLALNVMGIP